VADRPDVLIIGAGVIGCAVARELSRRGAGVRLFDARRMAGGATQASAGVLAPYIEAHERGPLFDLTVRSLGLYDSFVSSVREDSGIEVEYSRCGTLEVAADDAGRQRLQRSAQAAPGEVEWLDSAAARALEPALPGFIAGAAGAVTRVCGRFPPDRGACLGRASARRGNRGAAAHRGGRS
jgi:glycine oxidase